MRSFWSQHDRIRQCLVMTLITSGLFLGGADANSTVPIKSQRTVLGEALQLKFDPNQWIFYRPELTQTSGLDVFESKKIPTLHGFLKTEISDSADLTKLKKDCSELANLALSSNAPGSAKMVITEINRHPVCRVTKSDQDQYAVQFVFLSEKRMNAKKRSPASVHYFTHYLYFYYPKNSKVKEADQELSELMSGLAAQVEEVRK